MRKGVNTIWLLVTIDLLVPITPQGAPFTELIVSSGYRSHEILPTNGQYYAVNRDKCATLCQIDGACVAAFFSKSRKMCITLGNYSQPWRAANEWDALVKGSSFTSAPDTRYNRMSGSLYTPSGAPIARRLPYGLAADANHCQLMCDGASPTCSMFGYSSATRQCMLYDQASVAASAPIDASLYTYYRYTTVNSTTASAYSYNMLANDLTNISWIAFSVQACNDAHLTLQPSSSAVISNAYEFPIGAWGNTKACIRRVTQGGCHAEAANVFLNCNSPSRLWISWTGGLIRFGMGNVIGENIAFSYLDPSPYPVKAVGLAGWSGAPGVWSLHIPLLS